MNKINITSAQYMVDPITEKTTCINITINDVKMSVPLDPANRHYAAIMEMVNAETLTIAEANDGE